MAAVHIRKKSLARENVNKSSDLITFIFKSFLMNEGEYQGFNLRLDSALLKEIAHWTATLPRGYFHIL